MKTLTRPSGRSSCWPWQLPLLGALAVSLQAAQPPSYRLIDLGTYTGDPAEMVNPAGLQCLNNAGRILGLSFLFSAMPRVTNQFIWKDGTFTLLPGVQPPATRVGVAGLSDNGTVLATVWGPGNAFVPAILTADAWETFPVPPSYIGGNARAINSRGTVCGDGPTNVGGMWGQTLPMVWRHGVFEILPLPAGAKGGSAAYVNDREQIVGQISVPYLNPWGNWVTTGHAALWYDRDVFDLHDPADSNSRAVDINNRGTALIAAYRESNPADPNVNYVWNRRTGLERLVTPPGYTSVTVAAINDAGEIVGSAKTPTGAFDNILWRNGVLFEVSSLIEGGVPPNLGLNRAMAINARGQIVCSGFDRVHGSPRILLLDPKGN